MEVSEVRGDKVSRNIFTETWNIAYDIYAEEGIISLRKYLKTQVTNGNLTPGDAEIMEEDIVDVCDV